MTSCCLFAEVCAHKPKRVAGRVKAAVFGVTGLTEVVEELRSRGWQVVPATGGDDIRRAVREHDAAVVVMGVSSGDESGWLTCAKIVRARPHVRVVLIGPDDEETERFALFAGAAAYIREDRLGDVVRAVSA